MSAASGLEVGLDIGSTWVKALAFSPDGTLVAGARRATPWRDLPGGCTEMTAQDLVAAVHAMLDELADRVEGATVASIGVCGMAEAGVLLDPRGEVVLPVPAWFDPRGADELAARPADLLGAFPGVTGLPVSALATVAKLHHHRARGLALAGLTWLNVPEYVAHRLGGEVLGEVSLLARTGLVDQATGEPWGPMLEDLGVPASFLPPTGAAGGSWGTAAHVPAGMRGAVLSVAGHDHLVASVAAGVVGPHQLYDSMGTAEALVRVVETPLDRPSRAALAGCGVNVVRHMLPGRWTVLAGTRAGLVLRRVLSMVGVHDDAARDALDEAVMRLEPAAAQGVTVSGAANTSSRLSVHVDVDEVSPARLVLAALEHGTCVLSGVVATIDAHVGPATETVVAGGWTRMRAVRRARADLLPSVTFSGRAEDTAYGAALVGAHAAAGGGADLADHVRRRLGAD